MNLFSSQIAKREQSFTTSLIRHLVVGLCFMLAATTFAAAQGTRGTIRGIVTDPNGAVVVGATARLVDAVKQQEIRSVQTSDTGEYQFLEVEPSTYNIIISTTGFAEAQLNDVKVEPNRNLQLDVSVALGNTATEVTVTAAQEIIDRSSPTLGTTVDRNRVQQLPINGRDITALALLQPGVVSTGGTLSGSGIRVNGQRGTENNFQLDGSNNNEVAVGGRIGGSPRPDAVQEFRLLTSNFEAEFGRNTGAVINVVTRSGTNDFHGNARIFYRPTFLSAARYFDQDSPSDQPRNGPGDFRRVFERKEIGGNIGGPIYLPRFGEGGPVLYKGQNKAFFFVDYERLAQNIGASRTINSLPTLDERAGIFTRTPGRNADGTPRSPVPLLDPATGQPFPIISGTITPGVTIRQQIPVSRFSPIAQYYLPFLPVGDDRGQASVGANQITNNDYLTARTDFVLNDAQSLSVSFNFFNQVLDNPFAFGGASVPGFGADNLDTTYNAVVRHTYALSPTLINSLLIGYARNNQPGVSPQNRTTPAEIGFTGNFVADQSIVGPPQIRLFDQGDIRIGNSIQGPQTRVTENFQIQDSVSYAVGKHSFKFGFDGTKYKQDQSFAFINQGVFGFSSRFGGNTSRNSFADFLLGNPSFYQVGANGLRDFRQTAGALFVQDTWRVTSALTLSLGLRYEYTGPLTDKFNRVAYYRPGATSQLLTSGQLRSEYGQPIVISEGGSAPVGLVFVGDPDPVLGGTVPEGGVNRDLNNFAPRLGFAYSPNTSNGGFTRKLLGDRQTVIRGGFGVFYGAIVGDTALQQLSAPGFNGTNFFSFSQGSGTLADPFSPDPFPNFNGDGGSLTNPFAANQLEISAPLFQFSQPIDPRIRSPYTLGYNLTLERGFSDDYVLQVSYVGNRGRKLYGQQELNPSLGTFFPFPANDPRNGVVDVNPSTTDDRRLNNDIQTGLSQLVSTGNSYYDSAQVNLQKRLGNDGLLFQAAYTFSKSINDSGETQRGGIDLLDRSTGRSVSSDDSRHRFVGSFIYELPLFKNSGGFTNRLLGGFSLNGIYTYQSPTPFSVFNPFDETGTSGVNSFADINTPFQRVDNPQQNASRAFNVNAFSSFLNPDDFEDPNFLATLFRRGTSGRNQFRVNNPINEFTLGLIKKTRITETTELELRFEAFNVFNHTQFTTVNTDLDPSNIRFNADGTIDPVLSSFGRFTDTREPRVIQLAARFSF